MRLLHQVLCGATVLMLSFPLVACDPKRGAANVGQPSTGQEIFYLSDADMITLENRVKDGDGEAAFRLANYYIFVREDSANYIVFLTKAAQFGHPIAAGTLLERHFEDGEKSSLEFGVACEYAKWAKVSEYSRLDLEKLSVECQGSSSGK